MQGAPAPWYSLALILVFALSAAAQEPSGPQNSPPQPASAATPPATEKSSPVPANDSSNPIVIPAGTHLPLQLQNSVSTRGAKPGDAVYFQTTFPIVQNDRVVIPVGSYVSGEITDVKRPGRVKGKAELMIRLTTLIMPNAYQIRFGASPESSGTGGPETVNKEGKIVGGSNTKGDTGTVLTTTGAGAGIGAIAGGAKGAGIGAGIGAATGLASILFTRGPEAELPRGTTLDAVLDRALYLDASRIPSAPPGPAQPILSAPERGRPPSQRR